MSDEKKQLQHHPEVITLSSEITYLPCKFCGSLDYDMADGDVDDDGRYEPDGCDCCAFKLTTGHKNSLMWH